MWPEGFVRASSSLFLINANITSSIRDSYEQLSDSSTKWKSPGSKVTGTATALLPDTGSHPLPTKDNCGEQEPDLTCVVSVLNYASRYFCVYIEESRGGDLVFIVQR